MLEYDTAERLFEQEVQKFKGYSNTSRVAAKNPMFLFCIFNTFGTVEDYKRANQTGDMPYSLWVNWLTSITRLDTWRLMYSPKAVSDAYDFSVGVKRGTSALAMMSEGHFLEWATKYGAASYAELEVLHPKFINKDVPALWLMNAHFNSCLEGTFSNLNLTDYCLFWSLAGMAPEAVVYSLREVLPDFDEALRQKAVKEGAAYLASNFIFRAWYQGVDAENLPLVYSRGVLWAEKIKAAITEGYFYYSAHDHGRLSQVVPPNIRRMSYSQLRLGYHGGYRMPPLTLTFKS